MEVGISCKCLEIKTKLFLSFILAHTGPSGESLGRKKAVVLGFNDLQISHLSILKQLQYQSPSNHNDMSKKITLLVHCCLFLAVAAFSQDTQIQHNIFPSGPVTTIEFEAEEYDFGTIQSGEVVTQMFTFTNTGDEPFIISNARGSCGCTVPNWPKGPIAPGEQAELEVVFNSKNKKGQRMQKITITGNTNPPQTFLYLKGMVEETEGEEREETPAREVVVPDFLTKEDFEVIDCFAIYPNPTADLLKLEIEGEAGQPVEIKIFSKTGQLISTRQLPQVPEEAVTFDVSHYATGSYVATIQIGKNKPKAKCFVVSGY
jgi:hypothetical protein